MKQQLRYIFLVTILSALSCQVPKSQAQEGPRPSEAMVDLLVKHPGIRGYFDVSEAGIRMYSSPYNKKRGIVECMIYPEEYKSFGRLYHQLDAKKIQKLYLQKGKQKWADSTYLQWLGPEGDELVEQDSLRPLAGWRIALDPGHIAGDMKTAELEGKYIRMEDVHGYDEIEFWEANLTLATAHLAADELTRLGARVLVTRPSPNQSIRGMSYDQWKKSSFESSLQRGLEEGWIEPEKEDFYRKEAEEKDILRGIYVQEDLRERALKINAFQPDLTMIIHYNVHAPNWEKKDKDGSIKPTEVNYLMAFTPGSFMEGELRRPLDRIEFLRLLLTDDLQNSIELCSDFVEESARLTQVPIVDTANTLRYLSRASIYTGEPGVYARNLSLTRLVHGPICYGESLCQDNEEECLMLMRSDFDLRGIPTPERIREIADAYVRSILVYAADHKPLR